MDTGQLRFEDVQGSSKGSENEPGIVIAAFALSVVTFAAWLHSHPLVLPLLSIVLVIAALGFAAVIALRHRRAVGPLMDKLRLAGLLMFFGFAAAIMGDPDLAVKSLDEMR